MEMIARLNELIEHLGNETFLHNDQPMTCPYCGRRTIMLLDLSHLFEHGELHQCYGSDCGMNLIAEGEEDET